MRLWLLFLRSRRAFPAAAGLLLCAALCWAIGSQWGEHGDIVLLTSLIVPLAAAAMIGATTTSPFGELELTLSRPLGTFRLGELAGLLSLAAAALFGAVATWEDAAHSWQFARNALGLCGLGLLSAQVVGGRWAWAAPLGFCMLALFQRGAAGDAMPRWAWVVEPASRATSFIALGLLAAGLLAAGGFGGRVVEDGGKA